MYVLLCWKKSLLLLEFRLSLGNDCSFPLSESIHAQFLDAMNAKGNNGVKEGFSFLLNFFIRIDLKEFEATESSFTKGQKLFN